MENQLDTSERRDAVAKKANGMQVYIKKAVGSRDEGIIPVSSVLVRPHLEDCVYISFWYPATQKRGE